MIYWPVKLQNMKRGGNLYPFLQFTLLKNFRWYNFITTKMIHLYQQTSQRI